jgi:hypothetical protein
MTKAQTKTSTDANAVERLSQRFARVFEDPATAAEVFSSDAFFDLNMPVWRFQVQGAAAFAEQIKEINEGAVQIRVLRTVPTNGGFVTEHEEHQEVGGQDLSARRLWLCAVNDERIVEAVGYCSGEWDEELRIRHAIEAPMIRP